jgi:hypothetical protein
MMQISGTKALKDQNEHLLALASVLGYPMTQLRANHFRSADRALIHLNHFFTQERAQVCKEWQSTQQSMVMLRRRLSRLTELEQKSINLEQEMAVLEDCLAPWREVTSADRRELKTLVTEIRTVLDKAPGPVEAAILERHELYTQLKSLVPYAEEVDHLCAAVKHYARRDEYEAEKRELERKIASAAERIKSVKRGFVLALILCVLVVTIPLCVPFAFSLWNRLRDIRLQHAQLIETKRRVLRKLELAAEGVIAAEDITEVLGERSLADVRSVLEEVRTLHTEFTTFVENGPALTKVLVLLGRSPELVQRIFGDGPESLRDRFAWIVRMYELRTRQSQEIVTIAGDVVATRESIQQLLKGYNPQVLQDTIDRLQDRLESIEPTEVSREFFATYTRLCKGMPKSLENAQSVLSKVSYGKDVTDSEWTKAGLAIVTASTTLNAMVAEAELAQKDGLANDSVSSRSVSSSLAAGDRFGTGARAALATLLLVLSPWSLNSHWSIEQTAHAADDGGSTAMANYLQDRISIDGVSSVPKGEKRTGLEAEIVSRRNGIEALGGQLKKICKETSLSSNWKDLVRSNGSEIYLDQTIKILLIGKLSEVITATKDVAATQIVAADGKPLAFRIPAAIPLAGTQCGAVFLNLPDGGQLRVFPMRGTASESQTIVTLASDKSRMALQGAAQGDRDQLRNSNLTALVSQMQGQVLRLPLEGQ